MESYLHLAPVDGEFVTVAADDRSVIQLGMGSQMFTV